MSGAAKIPSTGLTIKETRFVAALGEQVKNGEDLSPTKAALQAYDTKSAKNADQIARVVFKKERVIKAFDQLLKDSKLDLKAVAGNLARIANSRNYKLSGETVLKANIEALKIHGAYPTKQNNNMNININVGVNDMNIEEIRNALKTLDGTSDILLDA